VCLVSMKRALRLALVLFVVFMVNACGGASRTIGSPRRSAANTSRARVASFSFTSNSSRATRLGFCYDFWTFHRAFLVRGCQCRFLLSLVIFREVEGQPAVWPHLEQHQLARGF